MQLVRELKQANIFVNHMSGTCLSIINKHPLEVGLKKITSTKKQCLYESSNIKSMYERVLTLKTVSVLLALSSCNQDNVSPLLSDV